MMFEIKHQITGAVLFSLECGSIKVCVEAAVKAGACLSRADLPGANLSDANLSRADLSDANLSRACLYGADLSGANLSRACLYGADLSRACLYGADLSGADLSRADLSDANLSRANGFDASAVLPQIQGTRHFVRMDGRGIIKIGCISKPIAWWLENNVRCGEENGYAPEQIAEYRRYIELIAAMYPEGQTE